MTTKTLTVITVNYHSSDLIHRMEQALSNLDWIHLIVVDNSGDHTTKSQSTTVIKSQSNIGFGRACNIGAQNSTTQKILFLNPDSTIKPDDLSQLAKSHPDSAKAIWGPAIVDSQNRVRILEETGLRIPEYRRTAINVEDIQEKLTPTTYISGACLMTTKSLFISIGGFWDEIFLYAEDLDLCVRAKAAGAQISLVTNIRAHHAGGRSTSKPSARMLRLLRSWHGHYKFFARKNGAGFKSAINALHLASGI